LSLLTQGPRRCGGSRRGPLLGARCPVPLDRSLASRPTGGAGILSSGVTSAGRPATPARPSSGALSAIWQPHHGAGYGSWADQSFLARRATEDPLLPRPHSRRHRLDPDPITERDRRAFARVIGHASRGCVLSRRPPGCARCASDGKPAPRTIQTAAVLKAWRSASRAHRPYKRRADAQHQTQPMWPTDFDRCRRKIRTVGQGRPLPRILPVGSCRLRWRTWPIFCGVPRGEPGRRRSSLTADDRLWAFFHRFRTRRGFELYEERACRQKRTLRIRRLRERHAPREAWTMTRATDARRIRSVMGSGSSR